MRASSFDAACRVAYKELLDGVRHRAGYVTMGMFALTVIAFMSMSLAGDMPDARQAATLYWIVLFFAATLQGNGSLRRKRRLERCSSCGSTFRHRRCCLERWRRILSRCSYCPSS